MSPFISIIVWWLELPQVGLLTKKGLSMSLSARRFHFFCLIRVRAFAQNCAAASRGERVGTTKTSHCQSATCKNAAGRQVREEERAGRALWFVMMRSVFELSRGPVYAL